MAANDGCYLTLCKNPVRFNPVTAVNNVFFDEANKQIFAMRYGGSTGIVVSGPDDKTMHSFRLTDKGPLISIKFSYGHRILALQRSCTEIEFVNFDGGSADPAGFSQGCKGKNNKILKFHWISSNEIVFVTEAGIEFYQVLVEKKQSKLLKVYNFQVNWSIFSPESSVLLCSTSQNGTVLCPFYFKNSQVLKLLRFDVGRAVSSSASAQEVALLEKDATMATLYGNLYITVLRHAANQMETGTEVHLYLLSREAPAKRAYVLVTRMVGRFAVNVIDNLVVVHHQPSKSSLLFDIKLPGESRNSVVYLQPVVEPSSIAPYKLQMSGFGPTTHTEGLECELYSPTWIVFQPDIIIDAALGCMWFLQVKLDILAAIFQDVGRLIDFLLLRRNSKAVILKVLKRMLCADKHSSYKDISLVFDKLNVVYRDYTVAEQAYLQMRKQDVTSGTGPSTSTANSCPPHRLCVVIDESDMYTHVLSVMARRTDTDQEYVAKVVVEYARSLSDHGLPVQHYFYELLINALISCGKFHQLQQYLHYDLFTDSRIVAGHLLSAESTYPAACQAALDMSKKLPTSNDEVIDILLSKQKVLAALRFVKDASMQDTVSARKFLEAAYESGDDMLFYDAYKFFELRNVRLRSRKEFAPGEQCERYTECFNKMFGGPATT